MQINISTGYALQIMLYLAKNRRTVSSLELTKNIAVSQRYLFEVAGKLRNGGFIETKIGKGGGYTLNKEPSMISLYDVILLMEGGVHMPDSVAAPVYDNSRLVDALRFLTDYIEAYFRSFTLDKLTN